MASVALAQLMVSVDRPWLVFMIIGTDLPRKISWLTWWEDL
jgi:hypothetical protein